MSLKGIIFFGLFLFSTFGATVAPHLGVYGYIADYCIGPSQQWWEAPFSPLGIRYSFSLALAIALGMVLQRNKLRFGGSVFLGQEALMLTFLTIVWLSVLLGDATVGRYSIADHPTVKFTKVFVFCMMMSHVITDRKKVNALMWVFVLVSLALGLQAWGLPRRAFVAGRLEGIGGADFAEANFFAAFLAAMLPIIGIKLLQTKKIIYRGVCAVSAAFTANAVVLCRSRGALVGIAAGCLAALMYTPKKLRKKIIFGLILGVIGGFHVVDDQYLERISTITSSEEERDESAGSRLRLWVAGLQMVSDSPLGIGVGNWYQTIGRYIPEYEGKDCHSTFVKCIAELGLHGFLIFFLIVFNGLFQLFKIKKQSAMLPPDEGEDFSNLSFAITLCIIIILTAGLTISMIYTEIIWVLLMLPVCLRRAFDNALMDHMEKNNELQITQ
jgi:probable O-glycosylation ligase (exosortase A-associated)